MSDACPTSCVWDLPVRLFHWSLVVLVAAALASGFQAPAWWLGVHLGAGYTLLGLLALRLVWGFLGSEFSRIDHLGLRPRQVLAHLADLARCRPRRYLGHNPAGAAMITALLGTLAAVVASGMLAQGGQEKQGPLAPFTSYAIGHAAKEAHQALALLLVGLVALHVAGVVVESLVSRENLVRAMLDGRKLGAAPNRLRRARPAAAAVIGATVLLSGAGLLGALAALPPRGIAPVAELPAHRSECGSCHHAFHPSLLPASSWRLVMSTLEDHFGEDASLPSATASAIEAFLVANSAETRDSEAANRMRAVAPEDPRRITAAPFWRKTHRGLPDALLESQAVGGRTSCAACHHDADSGLFADQAIALPAH